jgi:DNA polymerase-1
MRLCYDIECDGLDPSTVWCLVAIDVDNGTEYCFSDHDGELDSMYAGIELLKKASSIIGHNIIGFDNVVMKKLYNWSPTNEQKLYDTWTMSQTNNYFRGHKHGLAAWGKKLEDNKIVFDDWERYSKRMLEYCIQDVRLNVKVWKILMKEVGQVAATASQYPKYLRAEHDAAEFEAATRVSGWRFDYEGAISLVEELQTEMGAIEKQVEPKLGFHKEFIDKAPKTPKYKKNGEYTATTVRMLSEYFDRNITSSDALLSVPPIKPNMEFQRVREVKTKLGNLEQVKEYLYGLGWEPDDWNVKRLPSGDFQRTGPKLTSSSLEKLGDIGRGIDEWTTLRSRLSITQGWIRDSKPDDAGVRRLHGRAWNIGTPTFRWRHEVIANLPGAGEQWGRRMRALFLPEQDHVVVGADSAGNQFRVLAHFIGNEDFTNEVLNGDVHQKNADILGCSRSAAKRWIYAYLFGAGAGKLGLYLTGKMDPNVGQRSKDQYAAAIPGLADLKRSLENQWQNSKNATGNGFIKGLGGQRVYVKENYQTLNYLLQSAEAATMKIAIGYIKKRIAEEGIECEPRLMYHDEFQYSCKADHADKLGEILVEGLTEAPKILGVNIMSGDYEVGNNLAETH